MPFTASARLRGDLWLATSEPVELTAEGDANKLFAAVKRSGNDLALMAVNCNGKEIRATFRAKGLPKRLYLGGDKTPVTLAGDALTAVLPPFGTRIWYARPKTFSPSAAHDKVEAAEAEAKRIEAERVPGTYTASWTNGFHKAQLAVTSSDERIRGFRIEHNQKKITSEQLQEKVHDVFKFVRTSVDCDDTGSPFLKRNRD